MRDEHGVLNIGSIQQIFEVSVKYNFIEYAVTKDWIEQNNFSGNYENYVFINTHILIEVNPLKGCVAPEINTELRNQ